MMKLIDFVNRFENNLSCSEPTLNVQSAAHVTHAFADNTYLGKYYTHTHIYIYIYIKRYYSKFNPLMFFF